MTKSARQSKMHILTKSPGCSLLRTNFSVSFPLLLPLLLSACGRDQAPEAEGEETLSAPPLSSHRPQADIEDPNAWRWDRGLRCRPEEGSARQSWASPGQVATAAAGWGLASALASAVPSRAGAGAEGSAQALAAGVHAAEAVLIGAGSQKRFVSRVLAFHSALRALDAEGGLLSAIDECIVGLEDECADGAGPDCGLTAEEDAQMRSRWYRQFTGIAELNLPDTCLAPDTDTEILIRAGAAVATWTRLAEMAQTHPQAQELLTRQLVKGAEIQTALSQAGLTPPAILERFLEQSASGTAPAILAQAGRDVLASLFQGTDVASP